jgi:hypothetical protein
MAGISTFCPAAAFASSSKSRYQPVTVDRFAQHVALAAIDCRDGRQPARQTSQQD